MVKRTRNVTTMTTLVGAHSHLSQGNMRCSAEAAKLLQGVALAKGDEIAACIARGSRSGASGNKRKTVQGRDVKAAVAARC